MIPKTAHRILIIAGPLLLLAVLGACWPRLDKAARRSPGAPPAAVPVVTGRILAPLDLSAASGLEAAGGFRKIAENGQLALYLDPVTTEVAVEDKGTGAIWYSNPPGRREIERIARGGSLEELGAQFTISYYKQQRSTSLDQPSVLMKLYKTNNLAESVRYNQFKLFALPGGVRIEYIVGKAWEFEDNIPKLIEKDRFEASILSRLTDPADRRTLLDHYIPVSFVRAEADNRIAIADLDQEKLFGGYTLIPLGAEYRQKAALLRDGGDEAGDEPDFARQQLNDERRTITWDFIHTITDNRRGGIGVNQLKADDFTRFRDKVVYYLNPPPKFMRLAMAEIVQKAGYTPEDVQEDCRRNGIDGPVPDPAVFTIPVEYTLSGENLVVRIPCREIKYPRNVLVKDVGELNEKVTFPLNAIGVLPFFGAADPGRQGEIFVPDGSGALIHLNNGKTNVGGYIAPVYGWDNANEPKRSQRLNKKTIHLPIFGMRQGTRGFLAIIEQGAALAKIRAEVAGRVNSYNSVSAEFTTMPVTTVGFGAVKITEDTKEVDIANEEGGVSTVYQQRLYQGDIKIRYAFLGGRDAGYVGMAKYYRSYLMKTKGLTRLPPASDLPFFLELIGAIPVRKPVMGINRVVLEPVTTFSQGSRIARALYRGGVANLKLEYDGIFRGGTEPEYPARVRLAGEMGNRADLLRLNDLLGAHNSEIYPTVNLLNIYRAANGFKINADSARYLNRLPARIFSYNPATYMLEPGTEKYVLSPAGFAGLADGFLREYRQYPFKGLAIGPLGTQLNADYRENEADLIDREQALRYTVDQYRRLKGGALALLTDGANDYALPFVRNIVQVPLQSSRENLIDEDVPFYQIVLHGLANLAGEPLNLADDYRTGFLKALETGCSLSYRWFYRESAVVKDTGFADLYAGSYRDWLPDALRSYREANRVLGGLQNRMIVGHERLRDGVSRTTYENGWAVTVNYGDRPVVVDGLRIRARDYVLQRGEGGSK